MSSASLINLAYVLASVLFIFGLKGLSHPRRAVRGNMLGATGMLIAIVATLFDQHIIGFRTIIVALALGSVIGLVLAIRVQMTAMPQMVALLNGFGGAASVLVAGAELHAGGPILVQGLAAGMTSPTFVHQVMIATVATGIIGAVTFWGSLVAFAKLEEYKFLGSGRFFPMQQLATAALLLGSLALAVYQFNHPATEWAFWLIVLLCSILGVLLVSPIGGADMPVVIALLNSYSGLAATATGFVINNTVLIIAGSLVGASGVILTMIMCKAMNRSLPNVIFGKLGPTTETASADEVYAGKVKSTSAEEVAMMLDSARKVCIVPGYGMAVSQAQHAVRDLSNLLQSRGADVFFAIHPVAGRMPGHMNVLLAEADIPYDKLLEMDTANPQMPEVDVAIVIGANDVVNPVARTDPKSPIAGMPIIDVDKARTVVVVKRSLSPGFAGIPNPLFAADNTLMFYGDGKKAFLDLIAALKES